MKTLCRPRRRPLTTRLEQRNDAVDGSFDRFSRPAFSGPGIDLEVAEIAGPSRAATSRRGRKTLLFLDVALAKLECNRRPRDAAVEQPRAMAAPAMRCRRVLPVWLLPDVIDSAVDELLVAPGTPVRTSGADESSSARPRVVMISLREAGR